MSKLTIKLQLARHVEAIDRSLAEAVRDLSKATEDDIIEWALDRVSKLDIQRARYSTAQHHSERIDESLYPEDA